MMKRFQGPSNLRVKLHLSKYVDGLSILLILCYNIMESIYHDGE
jgi:hypothetical protein